jgi:hypothetical protein
MTQYSRRELLGGLTVAVVTWAGLRVKDPANSFCVAAPSEAITQTVDLITSRVARADLAKSSLSAVRYTAKELAGCVFFCQGCGPTNPGPGNDWHLLGKAAVSPSADVVLWSAAAEPWSTTPVPWSATAEPPSAEAVPWSTGGERLGPETLETRQRRREIRRLRRQAGSAGPVRAVPILQETGWPRGVPGRVRHQTALLFRVAGPSGRGSAV